MDRQADELKELMKEDTERQLGELYSSLEAEDKAKESELQNLRKLKDEVDGYLDDCGIPKLKNTLERIRYVRRRIA